MQAGVKGCVVRRAGQKKAIAAPQQAVLRVLQAIHVDLPARPALQNGWDGQVLTQTGKNGLDRGGYFFRESSYKLNSPYRYR